MNPQRMSQNALARVSGASSKQKWKYRPKVSIAKNTAKSSRWVVECVGGMLPTHLQPQQEVLTVAVLL